MKDTPLKNPGSLNNPDYEVDYLYSRIAPLIRDARKSIMNTINTTMVSSYWEIGRYLVEEEQKGQTRAGYGKEILQKLSKQLSQEFGRGFGITTLEDIRKFYLVYSEGSSIKKTHALREEFHLSPANFNLSWTHYRALM